MSDLARVLSAYGFTTQEQQRNVVRFLYLAGSFDPEPFEFDLQARRHDKSTIERMLKTARTAAKSRFDPKDLEQFDPDEILSEAFAPTTSKWPQQLHEWFIHTTQVRFFARPNGLERWQQNPGEWLKHPGVAAMIKALGLENAVLPKEKSYDYVVVLGSTKPEMTTRLQDTADFLDSGITVTNELVLLGSARKADPKVDGGPEYLEPLAKQLGIPLSSITETDLMRAAYDEVAVQKAVIHKLRCTILDTPNIPGKPRPATEDTIRTLINTTLRSKSLEPPRVLFVSRAPNIQAQAAAIVATFAEELPDVSIETVGGKCHDVAANRIVGGMAGACFFSYPETAIKLGSTQAPATLRKHLIETLSCDAILRAAKSEAPKPQTSAPSVATPVTQLPHTVPEKSKSILSKWLPSKPIFYSWAALTAVTLFRIATRSSSTENPTAAPPSSTPGR